MKILRVFFVLSLIALFLAAGCTSSTPASQAAIPDKDQKFVDAALSSLQSASQKIQQTESLLAKKDWAASKTTATTLGEMAQADYTTLSGMDVTPKFAPIKEDVLLAFDEMRQYADATDDMCNAAEARDVVAMEKAVADQKSHSRLSNQHLQQMSADMEKYES
jgi:hypothetical protein